MLYIYLPVLYYYGNLYVTEVAFEGGRGFPLFQRSFLFVIVIAVVLLLSLLNSYHWRILGLFITQTIVFASIVINIKL